MKGKYDVKKLWKRNQIMITALALMIAIAGYLNFTGKQIDDEIMVTTSAQFEEANAILDDSASAKEDSATIYDISDEDIESLAEIESLDSDVELSSADFLDEASAEAIGETAQAEGNGTETASAETPAADMAAVETASKDVAAAEETGDEIPGEAVFTSTTTAVSSLAAANLLKEQTRAKNKETLLEIINNSNVSDVAKQDAINSMIAMTEMAEKECSAEILLEAKGFEDVVVSISGDQVDVMVGLSELTDAQRAQIEDIVKRKTGITAENIIISPVGK
ncbi:MAG: SpoIIIAH-like family protein [Roseburia sp.]|nr:SpoIIIAH-like family protein [Roseburia sp.]MCM1278455.1 SpoIIIAH-like family protein [Robinsoniella sp.]